MAKLQSGRYESSYIHKYGLNFIAWVKVVHLEH